jgi:hypothetical protein
VSRTGSPLDGTVTVGGATADFHVE